MVPISAVAIVKPCAKSESESIPWIAYSAPEIPAVSQPNKQQPSEATKAP